VEQAAELIVLQTVATEAAMKGRDQAGQRLRWWGVLALILAEPGAPPPHWLVCGRFDWLLAQDGRGQGGAWAQSVCSPGVRGAVTSRG
jgi:hypothetical protein